MFLHRVVSLWCLTTIMSILAAEPSAEPTPVVAPTVTVVAGPWLLLGEDGATRCGIEIVGTVDPALVHLLHGNQVVAAPVTVRPFQIPAHPLGSVVEVTLPLSAAGGWTLVVPGRRLPITPVAFPALDADAHVAFAAAGNWPRTEELLRLGKSLGAPIDVVVAYSIQSAAQLGSGGWEANVPVVILPQPLPEGMRDIEQVETLVHARLGALHKHWLTGTRWGRLGLPWAADPATAARVIARDLSPWEVCLAPTRWWELGLLAPHIDRDAASTATLIALCQHLQVPLILTLGGGGGWISEPLAVKDDQLRIVPGATRVIAATPAGDGLGLLPTTVAEVIDEAGVIALGAERERLIVVGTGFSGADLLRLEIRRDANGFTGDGVGRIDLSESEMVTMRAQAIVADDAGAGARARCRWMTARNLGTLHMETPDVLALLGIREAPGVITLLRHLTRIDEVANSTLVEHQAKLPAPVLRDLLLRQIARHGGFDPAPWMPLVAAAADPQLLSAIMRAHQDGVDPSMIDLLTARVRAQASGATPIESDALLQHRLMTAVFDSTRLSPTILRPLAVALQPKLSPFTVGPVERFLARHGAVRR